MMRSRNLHPLSIGEAIMYVSSVGSKMSVLCILIHDINHNAKIQPTF